MRVLFTVFPAAAHLHPVVPVAWALQAAGHEVRIACHPGVVEPDMAASIAAAGLTPVSLGDRAELVAMLAAVASERKVERPVAFDPADSTRWPVVRDALLGMFSLCYPRPTAEDERWPMVDELVDFARAWRPDLVIWDPLCVPAAIAARACGAAHARLLWGLDTLAWVRAQTVGELGRTGGSSGDDPLVRWVEPMLARFDDEFDEEVLIGQWTMDLVPTHMRLPLDLRYVPVRRVPFNGVGTLPKWLYQRPERPRVCLTLGLSARTFTAAQSAGSAVGRGPIPAVEILDALADMDVEVVATLDGRQLDQDRPLPDNVRAIDYVPLNQLLPTCSAIIHHGGSGSFCAAAAQRIPQLVIPVLRWDESVTARYVADRGAGVALSHDDLSAETVREELDRLLREPSFADGAQTLYDDLLAAPSPADTVGLLERLTAEHRRP